MKEQRENQRFKHIPETVKLQEYIGAKLQDVVLGHYFLRMKYVPKAQATRAKVDRWDLMKPQTFCAAKEATQRVERQATEWEKIFAKHIDNKGLISKMYKKFIQFSNKIIIIQFKRQQNGRKRKDCRVGGS